MNAMIQIRNVPTSLHRKLKARAALAGVSLSDYLLGEIAQIAEKPTLKEWLEEVRKITPIPFEVSPADDIRAERDSR